MFPAQTCMLYANRLKLWVCALFYRALLLVQRRQWTYPILAAGHLQPVPRYILGISSVSDILCSRDKLAILLIPKHLSQEEAESTFVHAGGRARAVVLGSLSGRRAYSRHLHGHRARYLNLQTLWKLLGCILRML